MGVVMPDRDVAFFAQRVQHLEAVRLGYVFQVDGTEARLDHLDEVDDLVGVVLALFVVAVDAKGHAVHPAQVFHEEGLALHHAETAGWSHVAIPEDPGRVADDGHQIASIRQVERGVIVVANGRGDHRYAGRVVDVEPVETVNARLGDARDLAPVELVRGGCKLLKEQGLRLGPLFRSEVIGEIRTKIRKAEIGILHIELQGCVNVHLARPS